jgi:TatD DNase family protein
MLIDAHCHLDHFYYKKDLNEVIERAKKAGVKHILTNGIDYETNLASLKIAEKHQGIIKVALGFYPIDALDREYEEENKNGGDHFSSKKTINDNVKLIEQNKDKIIAIGEIGLDLYNGKDLNQQLENLEKMMRLAIKLNKPAVLHTRKAEKEVLDFLEKLDSNPQKVILHCFSGNKTLMQRAVNKGYIFSIPTNVVRSESFQYLVSICPITQILTETDGPYLSPFKNEDKSFNRNEPSYIRESIKIIAKIKNLSEQQVEDQILKNFERIFRIK